MDIIDISSDSGFSVDLIDAESLPDPAQIMSARATASDYSLVQLLYNLHAAFPSLNFLSFHPEFECLNVLTVHDLAVQSVYWIVESVGMSTAQALIVLGAAMSIAGMDNVDQVDLKGKKQVKGELEY